MSLKVGCMATKLLSISVWISVFVVVTSSSLLAQTPPGWKTYVNRVHGFSFAYPPIYERVRPPHRNLGENMDKAAAEGRWVELMRQGSHDTIDVLVKKERFDLDSFRSRYAPTGVEFPPRALQEGGNTFYGYGAGHQGFPEPDQFFFNLKGKTLYILVDGPFTDFTTTTDETKKIESQMLASFRTFPPAGSR
jgi:hypothetical protein